MIFAAVLRKKGYFYTYMTDRHKLLTQIKYSFGRGAFIKNEKARGAASVGNALTSAAE